MPKEPLHTPVTGARVPVVLMAAVRERIGAPDDMHASDVIRHALCALTGLDPEEHTPRKTGGPRGPRGPRIRQAA